MSLLSISCPHCGGQIQAPAGVQAACPLCGGQVLAEEGLKTPGKTTGRVSWRTLFLIPFLVCGIAFIAVSLFRYGGGSHPPTGSSRHTLDTATPASAVDPLPWDGSVPEARAYIQREARDPGSIVFHEWRNFANDKRRIITVDLTQTNGYGGPRREKWVFSYDKQTGELMTLLVNGKERDIRR